MNAFLLLLPLFLIRFGLLGLINKDALGRAAFFAPLENSEKAAYVLHQLSSVFIVLYSFFLKIQTARPLLLIALPVYASGVCVLILSTVNFGKPKQNGINLHGLYKISRNPMYMGYFIFFLGCALLTRSMLLLVSLLVFIGSTHWIILSEERWCINKFGSEYIHYMKKVRRYI